MNQPASWELNVHVIDKNNSHPLVGVVVEAWDKDSSKTKATNDLLFIATTDLNGACRGGFTKEQFQNVAIRHLDRHRPDIFYVIKDLNGTILRVTNVDSNIRAGGHFHTIKVDMAAQPFPANPAAYGSRSHLWEIEGIIKGASNKSLIVHCYDKDWGKKAGLDDWLFSTTSNNKGMFRHTIDSVDFRRRSHDTEKKPDLYFIVNDHYGNPVYTSKVFGNLKAGSYKIRLDVINATSSINN